jgi:hypothetical protein
MVLASYEATRVASDGRMGIGLFHNEIDLENCSLNDNEN